MDDHETFDAVAIASDHAGFALKQALTEELSTCGYRVIDLGTENGDSVDYPVYAQRLVEAVLSGRARRGVALCGTGIGVGIAANRHPGIRAAVCHSESTAKLARQHNDANILAMGARVIDLDTAKACLHAFLETEFEGGRHQRRVAMLG